MDSPNTPTSQKQPAIPNSPLVSTRTVPLEPSASADAEWPSPDRYGPLDDMLAPEKRPDPLNDTSETPDAISLSTDGYDPLVKTDLSEDARLHDQRVYVVDRIFFAGLTDVGEVLYNSAGLATSLSTISGSHGQTSSVILWLFICPKPTTRSVNVREDGIPGRKFVLTRASFAILQESLATGHGTERTTSRLPSPPAGSDEVPPKIFRDDVGMGLPIAPKSLHC